jgi:hypothetical protein
VERGLVVDDGAVERRGAVEPEVGEVGVVEPAAVEVGVEQRRAGQIDEDAVLRPHVVGEQAQRGATLAGLGRVGRFPQPRAGRVRHRLPRVGVGRAECEQGLQRRRSRAGAASVSRAVAARSSVEVSSTAAELRHIRDRSTSDF